MSQSLVQLRASGGLRAFNPGASPLYRLDWILFYLCLLSRVSPTNSETLSDLIYLANPCVDLCGARDRVATSRVRRLEFSEFPIF